jgi:hypothetical protein
MAAPVRTKIEKVDLSGLDTRDARPVLRLVPALPEAPAEPQRRRGPGRHRSPARPDSLGSRRVATCVPTVRHRRRLPVFFLTGVAVFISVVGIGLLAGSMAGDAVPDRTAVVWVEPGESLWQVAERSAPGYNTEAVVARIRELNELPGGAVLAGQALQVPSAP